MMFAGVQDVWRTTDNGGLQAFLDLHCNEFFGDFTVTCGDWVELGSPTGKSDPSSVLTGTAFGADRPGGTLAALTREPSDTRTLWVATSRGEFLSLRKSIPPTPARSPLPALTHWRPTLQLVL